MRIFLLYHGRFPSEKAASLFAAQEATSFAHAGTETVLVVPRRIGRIREEAHRYFGLINPLAVTFVPTLDLFFFPFIGRVAQDVSTAFFSLFSFLYLLSKARRDDWIISNEPLPLLFASLRFGNTLYEVHDFPENKTFFFTIIFRRMRGILATNKWKAEEITKRFKADRNKIFFEPNAVDVTTFDPPLSRQEAREQLGLPDGHIVVYTGHLYEWKGVRTLAQAAELLQDVQTYIVGGTAYDIERFCEKYSHLSNVHIIGHRAHSEIPLWQRAADVLVLPNTAAEEISARYTSPMKLFEYMASGTPIVASDLPSISEIAAGRAILVPPDDPTALAKGIERVLGRGAELEALSAREWVHDHSWDRRAKRILQNMVSFVA